MRYENGCQSPWPTESLLTGSSVGTRRVGSSLAPATRHWGVNSRGCSPRFPRSLLSRLAPRPAVTCAPRCAIYVGKSMRHGGGMEYVLEVSDHCRPYEEVIRTVVEESLRNTAPGHQLGLSQESQSIMGAARGMLREDNKGISNYVKQTQSLYKVANRTSN